MNFLERHKVVIVLMVIQLLIGFVGINLFPVCLDEPFSVFHAQMPLDRMLEETSQGNNAPLHFILLHFWIKIFGVSAIAVRSLSLLISLFCVFFMWRLARLFLNVRYSVMVSLLFIFSRLDHFVSIEARMYGLFTLFFILILYDLHRWLNGTSKYAFLRLALWNGLLLYTHYLGFFVLGIELIVFIIFCERWTLKTFGQGAVIVGGTFVVFLPGFWSFWNRAEAVTSGGTWLGETHFSDLLTVLIKLFNNELTFYGSIGILLLSWILAVRKKAINKEKSSLYALVVFGVGFSGMFFVSILFQPVFIAKYLQFLTVPLFLFLGIVISRVSVYKFGKFGGFVVVLLFILSVKVAPDTNRETDLLAGVIEAEQEEYEIERIYYCPPHDDLNLAYHYDIEIFKNYSEFDTVFRAAGFIPIYDASEIELLGNKEYLLFVDLESEFLYPNNGIRYFLDNNCVFQEAETFDPGFQVIRYLDRKPEDQ